MLYIDKNTAQELLKMLLQGDCEVLPEGCVRVKFPSDFEARQFIEKIELLKFSSYGSSC